MKKDQNKPQKSKQLDLFSDSNNPNSSVESYKDALHKIMRGKKGGRHLRRVR